MTSSRRGEPRYDRALLLRGPKRNDVLELWEVQQYGRDSFGDPDYLSLYGLRPEEWFARGVRVLGRTAVACTRDALADRMARDVADALEGAPAAGGSIVIDFFAGSCNTLHWIHRRAGARSAVGFELEDAVFDATRRNLAIVGSDVQVVHEDWEAGLGELRVPMNQLLIAFVAPPWGAFRPESGLDLRRTTPPVGGVVDAIVAAFPRHLLLVAIQVYESTNEESVADVTSRFEWSARRTYDIDSPGRNHGLLLGTLGWSASDALL
jgi:hypothetical protein